ncbi:MAG TPA: 16S rRNA (cytosine(1402)-N(4))-methyltransferase, partial [Gemmatimonadetes bacterium]|nr:16S rRNA (cytosine(1402)-N(4))-methyltransferase [Gemmatimonadota bacterium]
RIAVTSELEALDRVLPAIRDAMAPGAPFLVIAYHSLEDRKVKNAFREWSRSCVCPPRMPLCRCRGTPLGSVLTRSPIRPTEDEVDRNPRARSARLRVWRKS